MTEFIYIYIDLLTVVKIPSTFLIVSNLNNILLNSNLKFAPLLSPVRAMTSC